GSSGAVATSSGGATATSGSSSAGGGTATSGSSSAGGGTATSGSSSAGGGTATSGSSTGGSISGGSDGGGTTTGTPSSGCSVSSPVTGTAIDGNMTVGTQQRTYRLSVPMDYVAGQPLPLVFVFNGVGGTGPQAQQAFQLEKGHRAIFIYPTALPNSQT